MEKYTEEFSLYEKNAKIMQSFVHRKFVDVNYVEIWIAILCTKGISCACIYINLGKNVKIVFYSFSKHWY